MQWTRLKDWMVMGLLANGLLMAQSVTLQKHIRFEGWSIEDGLSHGEVHAILQDREGFMWFGTGDGLNRFDGRAFRTYRHNPDDPGSLSDSKINCLFEDRDGVMWIGANNFLNRFDRSRERFDRYLPRNGSVDVDSGSKNGFLAIHQDAEGMLWLSISDEGLRRMDPRRPGRFDQVPNREGDPKSMSHKWVRSLYLDQQGTFWAGTNRGLHRLRVSDQAWPFFSPEFIADPKERMVLAIHRDRKGTLWVGIRGWLTRFDPNRGTFDQYRLPRVKDRPADIRAFAEDAEGGLWIGTDGDGLWRINASRDGVARFAPGLANTVGLDHESILSLFIDREGSLWVGTRGGGVFRTNVDAKAAEAYGLASAAGSPTEPEVNALLTDHLERLWFGTDEGLLIFEKEGALLARREARFFENKGVWTLLQDSKGEIWVGTAGGGLHRVRLEGPEIKTLAIYRRQESDSNSLGFDGVTSLLEDREGALWIGTSGGGLNRLDPARRQMTHFDLDRLYPASLSKYVTALTQSRDGALWIGSLGGLIRMEPGEAGSFQRFVHNPDDPESLSSDRVNCALEDSQGALWIGTEGGGLNLFDRGAGRFARFQSQHGLPSDIVYGLLESGDGALWLSAQNGLARRDPLTGVFRIFKVNDGLAGSQFSRGAVSQDRGGRLWFGGAKGLTVVDPNRLPPVPAPPAVVLTELTLFENPVRPDVSDSLLSKRIADTDMVRFSYWQNFIGFHFASPAFGDPGGRRYRYRLENWETDWQETDSSKRWVNYANLRPGEYMFRAQAAAGEGVWGPEASVAVVVSPPPPWQSPWAYVLYAVALAGAGYMMFQRQKLAAERALSESLEQKVAERTQSLSRKNQKVLSQQRQLTEQAAHLREMDALKTRFFTNISHELRTPLTLTLGPLEDLLEAGVADEALSRELAMMRRNGRRLNRLIDELLDLSKLEAGQMTLRARERNLAACAHRWAEPFQGAAQRKGVVLRVRTDQPELAVFIDAEKMEKAVHNLLSNALKFTPEQGEVVVEVDGDDREARLVVRDTGVGVAADQLPYLFDRFYQAGPDSAVGAGTGVGLALVKELTELHGGQARVVSAPGVGSAFTLTLPRGKAHLRPDQLAGPGEERPAPLWEEPGDQPAAADGAADEAPPPSGETATVLVVEDHADVRAYLVNRLSANYRAIQAENGAAGFESALAETPDLVISDVMMPVMDGFELCRRLKEDERTSHIPVILLTAKSSVESGIAGLETGADDYLVKPFHARALLSRIGNLIEGRRKLAARYRREMTLSPENLVVPAVEQAFLGKIRAALEAQIHNPRFGVYELAEEVGFSRRQLHRKITALTGKTPVELIRGFRLARAAQLLSQNAGNVAEVAYAVGFNQPQYFARVFRQEFGRSPAAFAENAQN